MSEIHDTGSTVVARRAAAMAARAITEPWSGQISPADGSVARLERHVSVYCAPCQRWIDCHEGIPPEVAHRRHGELFH